ncbi:hypothetical protein N9L39_01640 [Flavobacteriaceae bacterium]|nr:hypothetical protein [Flavobacteriaceae bacterium]
MIPVFEILGAYVLGLGLIVISWITGRILFRRMYLDSFELLFLGYLLILSCYAVAKTCGKTIALLVFLWIIAYSLIFLTKEATITVCKNDRVLINSVFIWTILFLIKLINFWNSQYGLPNLLFADYPNYMKLAESFQITGNENALGHRNVLFDNLNFLQPYRTHDLWLPSLGLDLIKARTIVVWELFYTPMVYFFASLSIFNISRRFKLSNVLSVMFSILIIFAFSGNWFRAIINLTSSINNGSYDPIGIISYPKLAVVYAIILHVIYLFHKKEYLRSIFFSCSTFLLVQSTLAVIPLIILFVIYIVFVKRHQPLGLDLKHKQAIVSILTIIVLFLLVYLNQSKVESMAIGLTSSNITNFSHYHYFFILFLKKWILMIWTYFWLPIMMTLTLLLFSKPHVNQFQHLIIILMIYSISTSVYAFYSNVGDSYQFVSNLFGPLIYSIIIFIFLASEQILKRPVIFRTVFVVFCSISVFTYASNSISKVHEKRLSSHSKSFLIQAEAILASLDSPYGIMYYDDVNSIPSREDFPLHEARFLKLFGRNYDVFNINALEIPSIEKDSLISKYSVYKKRSALSIYQRNEYFNIDSHNINLENQFVEDKNISYCLTLTKPSRLPRWLKNRFKKYIYDEQTRIYLIYNSRVGND